MFLLDANIIIYLMKGNINVARHVNAQGRLPMAISIVTYGELLYGAEKSQQRQGNLAYLRQIAQTVSVMDVTRPVIETFASIKAETESHGQRPGDFDLVIAATALVLGFRLVTNNERHFQYISGLQIENWVR